ncbi:conserved hypothetical protein [Talaromyces stipitatus ATCC 10500]|uniref:Uncharacterized protein n=1 Tax=Talaromyces stipitatus (strain ATCC 10500 / CBS 375.48 / QM 6759 / NRRL 1006) TaxID=441959 RepID=B8M872_TALSN|nr:uncharacterized protein TSTA_032870 [Talaromyces stipitatus ATCC 10500]EED20033.1 conserved hypothetical protein [Talaromyces stipitatus ATCC 10500]
MCDDRILRRVILPAAKRTTFRLPNDLKCMRKALISRRIIKSYTMETLATTRLHRFERSMESLYGNFSNIKNLENWTPPPNSGGHRGRYLWTDAFGVVNFLTLYQEYSKIAAAAGSAAASGSSPGSRWTGVVNTTDKYLILARRLVETVHDILGRTRDGKSRLPGATDENPLGGGLRIGKLDETGVDGDGQYHHYLTIWMFALNRLSLATGDPTYNRQAISLAQAIHPRFFVNRTSTRPRMVWKMSMDLTTALVPSEGNLDPIDGYVVYRLLQASALAMNPTEGGSANHSKGRILDEEIADYKRVMERKGEHFVSADTLDLGMTLWTCHWFSDKEKWAAKLAERCFQQIYELFEIDRYLARNIKYRLAFREFGTSLGIGCHYAKSANPERSVDLRTYSESIIDSWEPYMALSLRADGDLLADDLRPITRVMYSSALIPGAFRSGYLGPEPETIP